MLAQENQLAAGRVIVQSGGVGDEEVQAHAEDVGASARLKAGRPSSPAAIARGISQPNRTQAGSRSRVPAIPPPTAMASKALLFADC